MKYLPLYYEWMAAGTLPAHGLCSSLDWAEEILLFKPENKGALEFWTSGNPKEFNAIRQNIVLFLAAMNDEL